MNRVLQETMAGPLQGKKVVFLAEDSLFKYLEGASVLGTSATQTVLLTFPRQGKDNDTDSYRSIKPRKTLKPLRLDGQGGTGRTCVSLCTCPLTCVIVVPLVPFQV